MISASQLAEMRAALRCNLRQMGDTKHLVLAGEFREHAAHAIRGAAPDPCVHLIEDQHHPRAGATQHVLEREEDPRELTAGGDPAQRPRGLARTGREAKLRHLRPTRTAGQRSWRLGGVEGDLDPRARHTKLDKAGLEGPGEALRRHGPTG